MVLSVIPIIILNNYDSSISYKEIYIGYFLGLIYSLLMVSSTIGTLGISLATRYRYPEYIAFEKIRFFNFIERIENILAFIWLIDLICLGILLLISSFKILNKSNNIIFLIITIITNLFIIRIYQNTIFIYHYIFYIYLFIIIVIIIIPNKKHL